MSIKYLVNDVVGTIEVVIENAVQHSHFYNDKDRSKNLNVQKYVDLFGITNYSVLDSSNYDAFLQKAMSKKYKDSLRNVSNEKFNEALRYSPPLKWFVDSDGVEKFLLLEKHEGSFNLQYARFNGICLEKVVNLFETNTWIGIDDFKPYILAHNYMISVDYDKEKISKKLLEIQSIGDDFSLKCVVAMNNLLQ